MARPTRRTRRPTPHRPRSARARARRATARSAGTSVTARPNSSPITARFTHTFPGPGLYEVTASVTDNLGNTYSWTQPVLIDPPLTAAVVQTARAWKSVVLTAVGQGGEGNVVAAQWTFSNGKTAYGTTITAAQAPGRGRDDHGRSRQHGDDQRAHQLACTATGRWPGWPPAGCAAPRASCRQDRPRLPGRFDRRARQHRGIAVAGDPTTDHRVGLASPTLGFRRMNRLTRRRLRRTIRRWR